MELLVKGKYRSLVLELVVGVLEEVNDDLEVFSSCLEFGFEDVGKVFVGELLEV